MLIETKKSQAIIDFLKEDLMVNQNILGIIENVEYARIFVDDVENPKGVFVKKGYFDFVYSKEDSFIEEVCNTFKDDGWYGFSGVDMPIANKIKDKFFVNWENPCGLYYMPKENLRLDLIKHEVRDIDIKDAETIDKFYEFRDEGSLNAIKNDITNRPSSAIYIDGEIVCWCLVHDDNSMGIMYTKEEHRRKGYSVEVTMDLAKKIFDRGHIPYLQIITSNTMSPGLAKKCGFVECGLVSWFGFVIGTPDDLHKVNDELTEQFYGVVPKGKEYFLGNGPYCTMHMFLTAMKEKIDAVEGFELVEADTEALQGTWSELAYLDNCISNDELDDFKLSIVNEAQKEKTPLRLFIGILKGAPIVATAVWTHPEDREISIIYCLYMAREQQGKGIESRAIYETVNKSREAGADLFFARVRKAQAEWFVESGFEVSQECNDEEK